jgi:hypothetical protein
MQPDLAGAVRFASCRAASRTSDRACHAKSAVHTVHRWLSLKSHATCDRDSTVLHGHPRGSLKYCPPGWAEHPLHSMTVRLRACCVAPLKKDYARVLGIRVIYTVCSCVPCDGRAPRPRRQHRAARRQAGPLCAAHQAPADRPGGQVARAAATGGIPTEAVHIMTGVKFSESEYQQRT